MRKRISGVISSGLTWTPYVLDWIHEYRDQHASKLDDRKWEKGEIIADFLKFLENKVKKATQLQEFIDVMDKYKSHSRQDLLQ